MEQERNASSAGIDRTDLITVVIPNYNGMEYIGACLDSVLAGTYLPRIIVVDNASSDGSFELVRDRYPQVTLLRLRANTGFCHAVNSGLHITKTRYVMLLNNDTRVDPGCVQALYETIVQRGRTFSVGAKMLSMRDPEVIDDAGDLYCALGWAFARGKAKSRDLYGKRETVFSACAGAAMYRREVFEEIGYFDERHFCYLEDVDIGWRAMACGYRNLYEPAAIVYHAGSASSGAVHNPFKEEMTAGNNAYLLYKNMPSFQYALNRPLTALGVRIKRAYFTKKGLGEAYEKGIARGALLIARAQAAQEERAAGRLPARGTIWEEAGVGADRERPAIHPLYLGGKVPFSLLRIPFYCKIQWALWVNCIRRAADAK